MKKSLNELQLLLLRLSIALLAYPICKIIFFFFNYRYFSDVYIPDFIPMLFWGLRFDLSALVLVNSPFIILHIISFGFLTSKKWYQAVLKIVFVTVNSIAILADCVDLEYYKFTFKRTTAEFFDLIALGSDISIMLPQYITDFWYIILIWIALVGGIVWGYGHPSPSLPKGKGVSPLRGDGRGVYLASWLILNSLLIGVCIIAFRGGLQLRPIMPINASEYVSAKNIPLIINTPFSIIKSYGLEKIEEKEYFSEKELKSVYNPINTGHRSSVIGHPTNVFIIILESFSSEYIGALSGKKTHTPFLDSLIKESLLFDNAFANGKKSIEGIPSIIGGMPPLMIESYTTSSYGSNEFTGIASALKTKNYPSVFFHGGTKGTMGFDAFCRAAGFDNYYGRLDYNNDADYDGDWGIWDEEFFQYAVKKVSGSFNKREPFLATLFSLSSHHPYSIPKKYEGKFKGGELPILRSVEYTDYALRKFFESASKEEWFANTLFVITADHTGVSSDNFYSNSVGIFKIPILYYKQNSSLKGVNHKITQQIDILPTVLRFLNYDADFFAFGNNAFDSASTGYAINYMNENYQIFQDEYLLQFDGSNATAMYNYKTDSLLQSNILGKVPEKEKTMEEKLKAIIQTYYHSMIHNQLTAKNYSH